MSWYLGHLPVSNKLMILPPTGCRWTHPSIFSTQYAISGFARDIRAVREKDTSNDQEGEDAYFSNNEDESLQRNGWRREERRTRGGAASHALAMVKNTELAKHAHWQTITLEVAKATV